MFYIWLWKLQNNHVQGFQQIHPPHYEWMPRSNPRPPYQEKHGKVSGRITAIKQTQSSYGETRSHKI